MLGIENITEDYETSVDAIKNAKRSRKNDLDWLRVDDEDVGDFMKLVKSI